MSAMHIKSSYCSLRFFCCANYIVSADRVLNRSTSLHSYIVQIIADLFEIP